jgi:PAS domain S-box-containing protein
MIKLRDPVRLTLFGKIILLVIGSSIVPMFAAVSLWMLAHHRISWTIIVGVTALSIFILAAAYALARHLTRPIRVLMGGVDHIAKGDFSPVPAPGTHDELQDLSMAFNRMVEELRRFGEIRVDEVVAEKAKTEGIIYSSEDGVVLTDQLGHVQLINPKALEVLGLTEDNRESLSGRPIWSFVKDDRMAVSLRESVEVTSPHSSREVNLSGEGVRRYYLVTVSRITPPEGSGTNVWVVIVLRNITAEKELDQLKDDFLQSLTHDLRSPMTAVRGYMQVLSEEMAGPINAEQKKMLHIMENASTKLLHIVSNLLDTAKMSAGKLRLTLAECNLRQLVPNTVEIFHTEAAKKKITLTLDMPETISNIKVDPTMVERVLINLIGNAIKFTPEGGFVTVKFTELSDRIQGQVTDTGVGFPSEFMSRIFKKFEQVSGTRGGTGLGLAICKFIVDAHLGEINVRSKAGEGTTFTFTFPKGLEQNDKGEVFRVRSSSSSASAAA